VGGARRALPPATQDPTVGAGGLRTALLLALLAAFVPVAWVSAACSRHDGRHRPGLDRPGGGPSGLGRVLAPVGRAGPAAAVSLQRSRGPGSGALVRSEGGCRPRTLLWEVVGGQLLTDELPSSPAPAWIRLGIAVAPSPRS